MSGHYNAGQYNDAFKAKRLRNWQYGINHPGIFSSHRKCPTSFIADNRGYLMSDCLKDPRTSPWGDYRLSIWEETTKCDCVDRIRNPQNYDRPPCSIIVTRQRPTPTTEAKMTSAALAKTLFRPPPEPEVSVIVKNDDGKTSEDNCKNDSSMKSAQQTKSSTKSSKPNENNNCCTKNSNQTASLAVDLNPQSFPNGVVVDTDLSQLKNGAIIDVGPSNMQNTCNM